MTQQRVPPIRKDRYGAEATAAYEDTERRHTVC